jgi:hypothetical protein
MATSASDPVLDKEEELEGNAQNQNPNDRKTKAQPAESKQSPSDGPSSVPNYKDMEEEAYISRVYGTTTEETEQGNSISSRVLLPTPGGDGNTRLRRASKLVSREF